MNIFICHERFLFRFGADRVLILLGKGLKELGHTVTVMANRYDPEIVASFARRIIDCPVEGAPYLDLNEFTSDWLRNNWKRLFSSANAADVVIVGGWPFISAITFFREVCPQVIFIDFGVVPTYGYSEGAVITLEKLRALRRQHLKNASLIVGISRFIADSQSRPDAGNAVPVQSILLGADHLGAAVWPAAQLKLESARGAALNLVQSLKLQGKRTLLCLGRWEPNCYKNSQAAFDVIEKLMASHRNCVLVVLDEPSKVEVPAHLKNHVLPIGFPDDDELIEIMKLSDFGMSFSLWEGFNLPLAEMQWLGRPALVFNVGAHPEVVAHSWYLCLDTVEMTQKASELLRGVGPEHQTVAESLQKFRGYFRWERFMKEYSEILDGVTGKDGEGAARFSLTQLIIDVTNSTRDTANSGVIRVTRRLSRELQDHGTDPILVVWDESTKRYVLPTHAEYELLGQFNGPLIKNVDRLSRNPGQRTSLDDILARDENSGRWLLIPELKMESSFQGIRRFARQRHLKIAAIFHDSIPVLRPDLCNDEVRSNHRDYMLGLAECDLVLPNSHFSAKCLQDFWRESGTIPGRVVADVLPGEFGGTRRNSPTQARDGVHILCVSTLEPRKNHRNLIQACLWITEKHPELNWFLTLVGNRYAGAFEIADWVQEISAKNPRIKWLGVVDDATLDRLYQECTFTVYPSVIEGFGLPIVESIWHGRPCICYSQGVMGELAELGACLTTDVTDPIQLGEAIYTLATNEELQLRLSREAMARPLKTWDEYILELTDAIAQDPASRMSFEQPEPAVTVSNKSDRSNDWQRVLYPDCLCENWQMNDSERMALTGLLARQKPHCSIEVGTYCGGSLSLISQYSRIVFSIDIDETIPSRFSFPNVSFLTGRSGIILPRLFSELDKANIPVEFILIDGDHSAAGIISDLNCVLAYIPKKPLFVVLHDSFNPECRRGMLEVAWEKSPYCHWVDIDFVPGRMIEHHGSFHGELWGGLGAAYFLPLARRGPLQIRRTAEQMFQLLSAPTVSTGGAQ
ncbi:MAG: glycosyltransferase [Acidobacteriaceae bacterium]|nr:glycosyltransferase [Acidobacteriaceae bacterium]MBV9502522.1 glycosyltransferase [Acidobacteriaceae bacterium]